MPPYPARMLMLDWYGISVTCHGEKGVFVKNKASESIIRILTGESMVGGDLINNHTEE